MVDFAVDKGRRWNRVGPARFRPQLRLLVFHCPTREVETKAWRLSLVCRDPVGTKRRSGGPSRSCLPHLPSVLPKLPGPLSDHHVSGPHMKLSPDYGLAVGTGAQEGDIGSRGRRPDSFSGKMHVDRPAPRLPLHAAALISGMRGWRSVSKEGWERGYFRLG